MDGMIFFCPFFLTEVLSYSAASTRLLVHSKSGSTPPSSQKSGMPTRLRSRQEPDQNLSFLRMTQAAKREDPFEAVVGAQASWPVLLSTVFILKTPYGIPRMGARSWAAATLILPGHWTGRGGEILGRADAWLRSVKSRDMRRFSAQGTATMDSYNWSTSGDTSVRVVQKSYIGNMCSESALILGRAWLNWSGRWSPIAANCIPGAWEGFQRVRDSDRIKRKDAHKK
ncbi:hypothetical protein B0H17DRAFT_1179067 [Mycena rosella]|uniref:Uncharacterized protein n=1 Tax=Mycena rosella TaxID=1033263 RepID=A0AAD7DK50_MYCRO|nr:hypothetical protein B0H17DRAFT_1179067 [Mycena rosella]